MDPVASMFFLFYFLCVEAFILVAKFFADFAPLSSDYSGAVVGFVDDKINFCPSFSKLDSLLSGSLTRSVSKSKFTGKRYEVLEIIAPSAELEEIDKVLLVGIGSAENITEFDWVQLGGVLSSALLASETQKSSVYLDRYGDKSCDSRIAVNVALGVGLAAYSFDKYKTIKEEDDDKPRVKLKSIEVTFAVSDSKGVEKIWKDSIDPVLRGTNLARDLVIEPANVLSTCDFVKRTMALQDNGVEVQVLNRDQMQELGMNALLGVSKGSVTPPYTVVMKWMGAPTDENKASEPIVFIGKGVVFDSGGISIKPSSKMGDMKGDMSGAACVTGLMHALSCRGSRVNAIGIIGLVENMPSGDAQRPGDIVTSMSGQSIEIVNTDAEGRLVLADLLWYAKEHFKPSVMINIATLTGAIFIALGDKRAGLFSNDDAVSAQITDSGIATGELVWRMPMGTEYEKLIKSKFADMRNAGERGGDAIFAAQFLHRFVGKVPWVHLDIAGTATGNVTKVSKSWAAGWGVRLLDRWVRDYREKSL